jgi:CDP-4-dehydro-6-deoxyglucose reductase, E1
LILPRATPHSDPSWFGFPIVVREDAPFTRDDIVRYLEDHKIAARMLFGGNLLKQPAYADMNYRSPGALTNTDLVMDHLFWMGVYPGLTDQKIKYTTDTLRHFFEEANLA